MWSKNLQEKILKEWRVHAHLLQTFGCNLQRKPIKNVQQGYQLIFFMIIKFFEKIEVPWNGIHIRKSHRSNEYIMESNHLSSRATFLACDIVHYNYAQKLFFYKYKKLIIN